MCKLVLIAHSKSRNNHSNNVFTLSVQQCKTVIYRQRKHTDVIGICIDYIGLVQANACRQNILHK